MNFILNISASLTVCVAIPFRDAQYLRVIDSNSNSKCLIGSLHSELTNRFVSFRGCQWQPIAMWGFAPEELDSLAADPADPAGLAAGARPAKLVSSPLWSQYFQGCQKLTDIDEFGRVSRCT